jgi:hypothetical protein
MKPLFVSFAFSAFALVAVAQTAIAQSTEVTAINAVIERETKAYLDGDATAMANCWATIPESGQLYSVPDGTVGYNPGMPGDIKKMMAGQKPTGGTFRNTNYQIRIKGDAAFAQFDQVASPPKGAKEYAHETRYLEKFGATWKIVHVGAVYYKPGK